jgi:transcription-repair coupling factor (superfamily II helicase)
MVVSASISLSLRALLLSALERTGLDRPRSVITGLSGAGEALAIAAAARREPVLVVVAADREIEPLVEDVRFFVTALEGISDAEAARGVLPFPSHEVDPYRDLSPHLDVTSARASALHGIAARTARVVVASAAALFPRVSTPERLTSSAIDLIAGSELDVIGLLERLTAAGFTREDPVDQHGEFGARGGVVDIFPPADPYPIRVEFVGDTIESIRRYDPSTQRSIGVLDQAHIVPLNEILTGTGDETPDAERGSSVLEYCTRFDVRLLVSEHQDVERQGHEHEAGIVASYDEARARGRTAVDPSTLFIAWEEVAAALSGAVRLESLDVSGLDGFDPTDGRSEGALHVVSQPAPVFHGRLADWVADLRRARERRETALFVAATTGRAERTIELLREYELVALPVEGAEVVRPGSVFVATGTISSGFRLPDAALQIYAETDIFDEERVRHDRKTAAVVPSEAARRRFFSDFRDLKVGNHVVHVEHGIGVFVGLRKLAVGSDLHEVMELRYAGDDKLFVPVERLDLVQKYSGGAKPTLDRLGGTTWEKAKARVKKAMRDMAEELLKLYAARKAMPGHAFGPDTHWQEEFENAFPYELTPDQQAAIADIKRDMEAPTPMDRLLCGDVGYGKTEVAMRAAFKAVMDGKQVAFLAPTTVLAFQHVKTLQSRFAAFPVRIDMLSRFRSKAEQKPTIAALASGALDIIVGTHRLLSKDVQFRDLGLLVVDEEQRFGVAHKERLKQIRRKVDVLTMSATPIPRTLNMSLVGIRDMSIIETPPRDRLAIQTNVVAFDQKVIADAIRHERERGGQVYFVHNRVESIPSMGNLVQRLVPDVKLAIGHGQMAEDALERVMMDFVSGQAEVLLATTIVENGLDIPNANTLIVNRADRYGLAQLYQLRGRVGRSDRRAYAYLLVPPASTLSPIARKRLSAIKEFSDLGSGFRVAALDLEIRGAGNMLGGEQSGHIDAIGFEMYLKLLEDTIRELKGEDLVDDSRAAVNLKVDLRIDEHYIPDMNQRLSVYRRIAAARNEREIADAMAEVRDRYGPPPPTVLNLASYASIRVLADRVRLESLDREGRAVVLKFRPDTGVDPVRLMNLVHRRPELTMLPPSVLRLDLKKPAAVPDQTGRTGSQRVPPRRFLSSETAGSWWTKRAKEAQVAPGFNRETLGRAPEEDPRADNGLFDRVLGLLGDLVDAVEESHTI